MSCECKTHGWCNRYQRNVCKRRHFLCRTSERHRKLFNRIYEEQNKKDSPPKAFSRIKAFCYSIATLIVNRRLASSETIQERLRVCKQCPQSDYGKRATCRSCGCFIWLKIRFPMSECPKRKWFPARKDNLTYTYPTGKIGPYHRDDIAAVYDRLAAGQGSASKGGCGCGSKSPPASLPIIQGDP